jgi:hypothetical protein
MRIKKKAYFLPVAAAASRAIPTAAMMVELPTGIFGRKETPAGRAGDGVAGTAAEVTGAFTVSCDAVTGAVVVAVAILTVAVAVVSGTVLPTLWIQ